MTGRMISRRLMAFMLVIFLACTALAVYAGEATEMDSNGKSIGHPSALYLAVILSDKQDAKSQQAGVNLMKMLLARLMGTNAQTACYQLQKNAKELWPAQSIGIDTTLEQLYQKLDVMVAKSDGDPTQCVEVAKALQEHAPAPDADVELWFVNCRAWLAPKAGDKDRVSLFSETANLLAKLLTDRPGLKLHFANLGISPSNDSSDASSLDDLVRGSLSSPAEQARVITHNIPADVQNESALTGSDSFTGTVRTALGASIADSVMPAEADAEYLNWDMPYRYEPATQQGDVLLNVSFPSVEDPYDVQLLTEEGQPLLGTPLPSGTPEEANTETAANAQNDTPSAQTTLNALSVSAEIVKMDGSAWLLVRNLPVGLYHLRLSFEKAQQGKEFKVTLRPYRIPPRRTAWATLTHIDDGSLVKDGSDIPRGIYLLDVYTDAVDVPKAAWKLALQNNGQDILVEPQRKDGTDGQYHWQAQLTLDTLGAQSLAVTLMTDPPNTFTLTTAPVNVTTINRPPQPRADINTQYLAVFDVPGKEGLAQQIDLAAQFTDPDGDEMTFTLAEKQADPALYNAVIEGQYLLYQPLDGDGKEISLTIRADDGKKSDPTSEPPTITLHVTQASLKENMAQWRFKLVATKDATQSVYLDAEGNPVGLLYQPLTLQYRMEGSAALETYQQAQQQYALPDITEALKISVTGAAPDSPQTLQVKKEPSTGDVPNALLFTFELPAVNEDTTYELVFSADMLGEDLAKLVPTTQLHVINTQPSLRNPEQAILTLNAEIDGSPPAWGEKTLSEIIGKSSDTEIDLFELFQDAESSNNSDAKNANPQDAESTNPQDAESPNELKFHVELQGDASAEVTQKGVVLVHKEQKEGLATCDLQSDRGECSLDVRFLTPGNMTITIKADDGELSSQPVIYRVNLSSSYTRLLITLAISVVVALLLSGATLLLIWLKKPKFDGVYAELAIIEPNQDAFGVKLVPGVKIPLKHFGKHSVALSTLMVACRQPPVRGFAFDVLADIHIRPAKRVLGMMVCGSRAKNANVRMQPDNAMPGGAIDNQPVILGADGSAWICLTLSRGTEQPVPPLEF